jgi:hypothetical protein
MKNHVITPCPCGLDFFYIGPILPKKKMKEPTKSLALASSLFNYFFIYKKFRAREKCHIRKSQDFVCKLGFERKIIGSIRSNYNHVFTSK